MHTSDDPRINIAISLHRLSFILQRISDDILQANFGIGYSQFKLMIGLSKNPGCEQRVLAKFVNQTEAGISRQLRLMQDSGLVKIGRDKKDSRRRQVTLSSKGEKLMHDAKKHLEKIHAEMFASLSESDAKQLVALTSKLFEIVKADCQKPKP